MSDLPPITSSLPPRKRAKTQEEKEQRRIERILRNRRAAHASREKKRKHVEFLESLVHKLEANIASYKAKEAKLVELAEKLLASAKEAGADTSDLDTLVLSEAPIPDLDLGLSNFEIKTEESRSTSCEAELETPLLTTNPLQLLKPKKTPKAKKVVSVKPEPLESPIPISPLTTLIKPDFLSPFKHQELSTTAMAGSTLDITSNDYSLASSTFLGESRGSPVSIATDLGVDEYLSNLNNPLFFPTEDKSELSALFQEKHGFEAFDDDHVAGSRLHNPAVVFYDEF